MNFFGHDSNASNDPRIKKLLARYGFEGTGLYWHMVELITRHLDPPREQSCELQEDNETLAYAGRLTVEKTSEIVKYMVELGLFTYSKSKKIMNTKVLRRLSDAQKRKVRRSETDKGRTKDGQRTDTVRGEVKGSEVEDEKNLNRSEVEDEVEKFNNNNGGIDKALQKLFDQEKDIRATMDKPNLGSDNYEMAKAQLRLIERRIEAYQNK